MRNPVFSARAAAAGVVLTFFIGTAALAGSGEEKAKAAQCARDLCGMIVSKEAGGPDLSCDLTKTWEKGEIQKGADAKKLAWDGVSGRPNAA